MSISFEPPLEPPLNRAGDITLCDAQLRADLHFIRVAVDMFLYHLPLVERRIHQIETVLTDKQTPVESALLECWKGSDDITQLRMALLCTDDAELKDALKRGIRLAQFLGQPNKFQEWISAQPEAVMEERERLLTVCDLYAASSNASDRLIAFCLQDQLDALHRFLESNDWRIFHPTPHSVIDESVSILGDDDGPPGRISRLIRPGLTWQGQLKLPAQVIRGRVKTTGSVDASLRADTSQGQKISSESSALKPTADASSTERQLKETVHFLPDGELKRTLQVLRTTSPETPAFVTAIEPLLGFLRFPERVAFNGSLPKIPEERVELAQHILAWLSASLGITLIAPEAGQPFDALTMDSVKTELTKIEREDNTVAALRRPGLRRGNTVVLRAQVERFGRQGA